jgi:hypothetical protein
MIDPKEKVEIKILSKDYIKIEHNKQDIFVYPYIELGMKSTLLNNYVTSYFGIGDFVDQYIQAEYGLMLSIIDNFTNVKMDDETGVSIDIDGLVNSGLWDDIKSKIVNYGELRNDIDVVVKRISDQYALERSIGTVVDGIAQKAYSFLEKISNMDLSEEGIKKLVGELQGQVSEFNDTFVSPKPKTSRKTKKDIIQ